MTIKSRIKKARKQDNIIRMRADGKLETADRTWFTVFSILLDYYVFTVN